METGILEDLEQSIKTLNTIIIAAGITYILTDDEVMLKLKEEATLAKESCERIRNMVESAKLGE